MKPQKICSSATIKGLEKLINEFYYSDNYFVNSDKQAENKKTGTTFGTIKQTKKRYTYYV